jgi:hypothetical protein
MAFDLTLWKNKIAERFNALPLTAAHLGAQSLYVSLCGAALWPALEAFRTGDPTALIMATSALAGNLGANLLANLVQQAKDEAETARQIAAALQANTSLTEALDHALEQLQVVPQVTQGLSDADQQWLVETLRAEANGSATARASKP